MFRVIVQEDAHVIAPISRAARFESIPNYPDLHTVEEDLVFYSKEIETSDGFVVEDESGKVVGFILWRDDFISHLYVSRDAQRSGVGSRLLSAALKQIETEIVKLWTFQKNVKAVSFYRKHGFVAIKETDGENEERLPDVLFALKRA